MQVFAREFDEANPADEITSQDSSILDRLRQAASARESVSERRPKLSAREHDWILDALSRVIARS
jgi:hypothetical protein